jgi:hypothetical protein
VRQTLFQDAEPVDRSERLAERNGQEVLAGDACLLANP